MTKYIVAVEGKQYSIDVIKKGNEEHFMVKVDNKPSEVEIKNKFEYETPLQFRIGEKTHTVKISRTDKRAPFLVKVKDVPLKAEVKTQLSRVTTQTTEALPPTIITIKSPTGKAMTEGAVTAPMAGKIVSVKVRDGDPVKIGTVLCILEAMKMENEIIAPKAGTVQEVNVSEGSTVNEGDILIVIK